MNEAKKPITAIKTSIASPISYGRGTKIATKVRTNILAKPSISWSSANTDRATVCPTFARRAKAITPTACPPGNGMVLHEVDIN